MSKNLIYYTDSQKFRTYSSDYLQKREKYKYENGTSLAFHYLVTLIEKFGKDISKLKSTNEKSFLLKEKISLLSLKDKRNRCLVIDHSPKKNVSLIRLKSKKDIIFAKNQTHIGSKEFYGVFPYISDKFLFAIIKYVEKKYKVKKSPIMEAMENPISFEEGDLLTFNYNIYQFKKGESYKVVAKDRSIVLRYQDIYLYEKDPRYLLLMDKNYNPVFIKNYDKLLKLQQKNELNPHIKFYFRINKNVGDSYLTFWGKIRKLILPKYENIK